MAVDPRHLYNTERFLTVSIPPAMRRAKTPDSERWRAMVDWTTLRIIHGYSPNQDAMCSVLWLYQEPKTGRDRAFRIVDDEVKGVATFQRDELLSNTYQTWKVASVIAMHHWAMDHGDVAFRDSCREWLRACWAFNTLGAAPTADVAYQKGVFRWQHEGPWIPSAGMRSTPQHYNTSEMGILLAAALDVPARSRTKSWVFEVLDIAGPLGLSGNEQRALRAVLAGEKGQHMAAIDMLGSITTFCEPFHFLRWPHAVLTWHDRNVNGNTADVKASLWELEGGVGHATHLYPYSDPGERHPQEGNCELDAHGLVLTASAERDEVLELPIDTPIYDLVVGR